jgi:putative phosphoesterase
LRIAVFSDIHGNIHALEAVWRDIQTQSADGVYCLGDLVGYGAFPNEVTEFIRERDIPTVMGNYDEGVGFELDSCGCVYRDPLEDALGKRSLLWSREQTTPDNKSYLRSLLKDIRLDGLPKEILLVHGSPRKMNEYLYEDRPQATFERIARAALTDWLFFGHTHLPYLKNVANTWFANTGSVGKPKDGDVRAGYSLLDLRRKDGYEFRRVEYDVEAAARAVRESDLPNEFAGLLETGGLETAAG